MRSGAILVRAPRGAAAGASPPPAPPRDRRTTFAALALPTENYVKLIVGMARARCHRPHGEQCSFSGPLLMSNHDRRGRCQIMDVDIQRLGHSHPHPCHPPWGRILHFQRMQINGNKNTGLVSRHESVITARHARLVVPEEGESPPPSPSPTRLLGAAISATLMAPRERASTPDKQSSPLWPRPPP